MLHNRPGLAASIAAIAWIEDGIAASESETVQEVVTLAAFHEVLAASLIDHPWFADDIAETEVEAIRNLGDIAYFSEATAGQLGATAWFMDGITDTEVKAIYNLAYIAQSSGAVAELTAGMSLFADGITDTEVKAIYTLGYIVQSSGAVAELTAGMSLFADGITDTELEAVANLAYIAQSSGAVAELTAGMSWFADGITDTEVKAIYTLGYIVQSSGAVAELTAGMSWFADGITDTELEAVDNLAYIAQSSEAVAELTAGMSWFADGITDTEVRAIHTLGSIVQSSGAVAELTAGMPWFADGITDTELEAVDNLAYIAQSSEAVAEQTAGVSWFRDGITDTEVKAIYTLGYIAQNSGAVAELTAGMSWFADGITDTELEAVDNLAYIAQSSGAVAELTAGMSWFADGITDTEVKAIYTLGYIIQSSGAVAELTAGMSWFADGITDTELEAVDRLAYIAQSSGAVAQRIAEMPFLAAIEPLDVSTLNTLARLAGNKEELLQRVLAHPSLTEGVTDALTPIVTMLYGVAEANADLVDKLLTPESITIERRSIVLPLTGQVELAIVRTRPGSARTMNLLEHSVRTVEELMGEPLPNRHVAILYEDAVIGSFDGMNFGTHIALLSERAAEADYAEDSSDTGGIAHEVAHYYWSGNAGWVDEGAANFIGTVIERRIDGEEVRLVGAPCPYMRSISELDDLAPDPETDEFGCNYTLGERVFHDLYRSLDEAEFWRGVRDLYVRSQKSEEPESEYGSTRVGMEHIREVFQSDAAHMVIARWYGEAKPYDLSQLDTGPVDPGLPAINGVVDLARITMGDDDSTVTSFSAQEATDAVWCNLKYSYSASGKPQQVSLDTVGLYEDGFEFHRGKVELTAEAGYVGGTYSFYLGSGRWAPGLYWVYAYNNDRKVAEVQFEVTR